MEIGYFESDIGILSVSTYNQEVISISFVDEIKKTIFKQIERLIERHVRTFVATTISLTFEKVGRRFLLGSLGLDALMPCRSQSSF